MNPKQNFTEFVLAHQAALRMYVRGCAVKPDWVDDVAQECFLIAYKRFKEFDPQRASGATWLRGIAKHIILNESRKNARRSRLLNNAVSQILLQQEAEPQQEDHRLDAMRQCIAHLSDSQQELVRLHYTQNENAQSIAEQLGMNSSSIRKRLSRIRQRLRNCVEQRLDQQTELQS